MSFRLIISQKLYDDLVSHALEEWPRECCGLLAGSVIEGIGRVERLYRLINVLGSAVEYESEPRSMFAAIRDMTMHGWDVLAVYHSHPTTAPVPSVKDRERNYSEDVMNLIIGLTPHPPLVRGWWLTSNAHKEAEWQIEAHSTN